MQFLSRLKIDREKDKLVASFKAFEKYSFALLDYYFKGFELLRSYLAKNFLGLDLSNLDFEEVDKEIMADEDAAATDGIEGSGAHDEASESTHPNQILLCIFVFRLPNMFWGFMFYEGIIPKEIQFLYF